MKNKFLLLFIFFLSVGIISKAQPKKSDSALVAKTLHELLRTCRSVDFTDPNVTKQGTFYKAAPYIVYRGEDKKRAWKTMANYANEKEKNGVDNVCERINREVNRDSSGYRITGYKTEKESEGIWHVLKIAYQIEGVKKESIYAFLKIGNEFGLGDID